MWCHDDAQVPDGTALLRTLASKFEKLGMFEESVEANVRCGNARAAVDCCVLQNRWDKALELAEQYDFPQVGIPPCALHFDGSGRHFFVYVCMHVCMCVYCLWVVRWKGC